MPIRELSAIRRTIPDPECACSYEGDVVGCGYTVIEGVLKEREEAQMTEEKPSITDSLRLLGEGRPEGLDQVFEVLYGTLKRMCAYRLSRLPARDSFTPTVLLHELYLDLVGRDPEFGNRHQFFGYAHQAIKHIAISHIRRVRAPIRGGNVRHTDLEGVDIHDGRERAELALVEFFEVLARVEAQDPDFAEIIRLRIFDEHSERETAELLGISRRELRKQWVIGCRLLAHLLGVDRSKKDG
jgi:RNA polymerase sigma factor (sigma-70 family)